MGFGLALGAARRDDPHVSRLLDLHRPEEPFDQTCGAQHPLPHVPVDPQEGAFRQAGGDTVEGVLEGIAGVRVPHGAGVEGPRRRPGRPCALAGSKAPPQSHLEAGVLQGRSHVAPRPADQHRLPCPGALRVPPRLQLGHRHQRPLPGCLAGRLDAAHLLPANLSERAKQLLPLRGPRAAVGLGCGSPLALLGHSNFKPAPPAFPNANSVQHKNCATLCFLPYPYPSFRGGKLEIWPSFLNATPARSTKGILQVSGGPPVQLGEYLLSALHQAGQHLQVLIFIRSPWWSSF